MRIESLKTLADADEKKKQKTGLDMGVGLYAGLVKGIFARMRERGEKEGKSGYGWFLWGIEALKHFPGFKEQGKFLENYYAVMRQIDDVADGDAPLPEGYATGEEYIQRKIEFLDKGGMPKDEVEGLLELSLKLGKFFGADFSEESRDMLGSLQFDARRRGTHEIFDEKTLHHNFFMLDIRGGVKGSLKIFGEDLNSYEIIKPLGEAVRIYYNLRDFKKEAIKDGLVNISKEDCIKFGITEDMLRSETCLVHPGMQAWFKEQAQEGLRLMEEYHTRKQGIKFRPVTEAALKFSFERKAKSFMTDIVNGKFEKILGKAA